MKLKDALELGRVSNLPTVASNVAAAIALASGYPDVATTVLLIVAMCLAYVAGMFLNDAFDRNVDAKERPERPIPSGRVSAASVFAWGAAMLGASVALVGVCAFLHGGRWLAPIAASIGLALAIVLYDAWHKKNPLAPILMGTCRAGVYLTVALLVAPRLDRHVLLAALLLLAYVAGITYAARQEHLGRIGSAWPLALLFAPFVGWAGVLTSFSVATVIYAALLVWVIDSIRPLLRKERQPGEVPQAVMQLIAGIALLDALAASDAARTWHAFLATSAFNATLMAQKHIRGT